MNCIRSSKTLSTAQIKTAMMMEAISTSTELLMSCF